MIDRFEGQDLIEVAGIALAILLLLILWTLATLPPAPMPEPINLTNITPEPTVEIITPEPTPSAIPTLEIQHVDPYASGLRSLNQWFKFWRADVQGKKDLEVGIVAYRSRFLDSYTWWNPSTGNYYREIPAPNSRFYAVWIHQEMLGDSKEYDPSFWAFDDRNFALQVKDEIYLSQINHTYNPVLRIREFDDYTDYYDTVTAPPFGYYIRYTGKNPESGGYLAEKLGVLRWGKGNAHDGYIIYQVPRDAQLRDMFLIGSFGTFGNAQWRFEK